MIRYLIEFTYVDAQGWTKFMRQHVKASNEVMAEDMAIDLFHCHYIGCKLIKMEAKLSDVV